MSKYRPSLKIESQFTPLLFLLLPSSPSSLLFCNQASLNHTSHINKTNLSPPPPVFPAPSFCSLPPTGELNSSPPPLPLRLSASPPPSLRYHTGSLAFGSALIAFLELLQRVLEWAEKKSPSEAANGAWREARRMGKMRVRRGYKRWGAAVWCCLGFPKGPPSISAPIWVTSKRASHDICPLPADGVEVESLRGDEMFAKLTNMSVSEAYPARNTLILELTCVHLNKL